MSDEAPHGESVTLALSRAEQWTLHHILPDRLEQDPSAVAPARSDPPPVEVFEAFETLDAGQLSFTPAQLAAIQTVLAAYHHSPTWWELERPQIEQFLERVTTAREQPATATAAD